jgi:hypothetical protein
MIFSERARVSVFATIAFEVCVAFAIFVFHFLSADATGRGSAAPNNQHCETRLLFALRRYFPFDGAGARVALAVAAAFFWFLSCASCFLALSFDFGDLSPMESTSVRWRRSPSARTGPRYHLYDRAPVNVARILPAMANRKRLRRRLPGVILPALALVACIPRVPPHLENVERLCDTWCRERGMCTPGWNREACQTDCRERGDKRAPYWRGDYVESIVHCIEASRCEVLTAKDPQAICFAQTRPEPSETARRACIAVEAKQRECKAPPESVDDCLNEWNWRVLGDRVLEELIACERQACGAGRTTCIDQALGLTAGSR